MILLNDADTGTLRVDPLHVIAVTTSVQRVFGEILSYGLVTVWLDNGIPLTFTQDTLDSANAASSRIARLVENARMRAAADAAADAAAAHRAR